MLPACQDWKTHFTHQRRHWHTVTIHEWSISDELGLWSNRDGMFCTCCTFQNHSTTLRHRSCARAHDFPVPLTRSIHMKQTNKSEVFWCNIKYLWCIHCICIYSCRRQSCLACSGTMWYHTEGAHFHILTCPYNVKLHTKKRFSAMYRGAKSPQYSIGWLYSGFVELIAYWKKQ